MVIIYSHASSYFFNTNRDDHMMKEVFLNMIADKGFQLLLLTIIVFAISLKVNEKKRRDNERRRKYRESQGFFD